MLSKRQRRVELENCANSPPKRQKLDADASEPYGTAPSTQSKCITPVGILQDAVPEVTIINTNTEQQPVEAAVMLELSTAKSELMSQMLSVLIDEYNCNH